MEAWFWDIMEDFDDDMRSKYLKFVWGRSRLPHGVILDKHNFAMYNQQEEKIAEKKDRQTGVVTPAKVNITWAKDSIPRSHTCNFQFETPIYTSKDMFKSQLLFAMDNAQGIED